MSEPMIKVNGLSKRYRIGAAEKGYKTFREAIIEGITAPVRNLSKLRSLTSFKDGQEEDVIWALRDVSFEVNEGEVLGIIGRNGAGKTTILKILSRITEPTAGFAEIRGRVSSLLEVGTGFHPELTGRENVFLNGAILGMRKREIEQKFDAIVSFAEIEKFIDTPVKRYSSGMYVRLAFAVAAHLEPEVLLIDEVLAVGDAAFQKKCLGRMGEVAQGGRTVLFVSHNMGSIRSLCDRVIWIENGQIAANGNTDEVIKDYLRLVYKRSVNSSGPATSYIPCYGTQGKIEFLQASLLDEDNNYITDVEPNQDLRIEIKYHIPNELSYFRFGVYLRDKEDRLIWTVQNTDSKHISKSQKKGYYKCILKVKNNNLRPDEYYLSLTADSIIPGWNCHAERVLEFRVLEIWSDDCLSHNHGIINVESECSIEKLREDEI